MKQLYKIIFIIFASLFVLPFAFQADAAIAYGNGYYTNLCGSGVRDAATANTCNKGCNPAEGQCTSEKPYVVKWTCDGNLTECRLNETTSALSQSVAATPCGKTVQINVYKRTCRNFLGWLCNDSDLVDYMVWYSGNCPNGTTGLNATPTPTSSSYTSSCNGLSVISGNGALVPATVTLRASASDTHGSIQKYKFYFGDAQTQESTTSEIHHKYESSGKFTTRVDIQDSKGVWKTSAACQASVSVGSNPLESQKSNCSDVFVLSGNPIQPNTKAAFLVTGYDNKGSVKRYKMDFGNGVIKESETGNFEQLYETAGTYTVRGWIEDSQNSWKGGTGSCEKTVYVSTAPLGRQPETGTPTLFTILAVISGTVGGLLLARQYPQFARIKSSSRKTSKKRNRH